MYHASKVSFDANALSFPVHYRCTALLSLVAGFFFFFFFLEHIYISKIICFTVIPAGTIQIATQGEGVPGLHTLTMSNAATAGGAIVQYAQGQDTQFFVPGVLLHHFLSEILRKLFSFLFLLQYCIVIIHYCSIYIYCLDRYRRNYFSKRNLYCMNRYILILSTIFKFTITYKLIVQFNVFSRLYVLLINTMILNK